jgi:hypothetical protein
MTIQDAMVVLLAIAAGSYVAGKIVRKVSGRGRCGCGNGSARCTTKTEVGGAKFTTLVNLERPDATRNRNNPAT